MRLPNVEDGDLQPRWNSEDGATSVERGTAVVRDITRTILARSYSGSSTCEPGNKSAACEKPVSGSTETLPIILGVVIPISCAIIVFVFLHRRNKKKQAIEDMNDPHKSLDFGLDIDGPLPASAKPRPPGQWRKKGPPEMIITHAGPNSLQHSRTRGLSMDMLGSPYMLPAGLAGSRESLHSMSRSVRDDHDPYRPITFIRTSSETGRSPRPFHENASTYSASTTNSRFHDRSNLVPNAQRMSQSYPERVDTLSRIETKSSDVAVPPAVFRSEALSVPAGRKDSSASASAGLNHIEARHNAPPAIESPQEEAVTEISSFPLPPEPAAEPRHPPRTSSVYVTGPPRKSSMPADFALTVDRPLSDTSVYPEDLAPAPTPPPKEIVEETYYQEDNEPAAYFQNSNEPAPNFQDDNQPVGYFQESNERVNEPAAYFQEGNDHVNEPTYDIDPSMIYTGRHSLDVATTPQEFPVQDNRLSYMGLRPLPPDHPEENPEQRANRIRSFYKEYFDSSRPNPTNAYYEDFDADYTDYYHGDGWFDPESGEYYQAPQAAYAQPVGRRAMTPPPRGAAPPPRFAGAHDRHYSTMSGGRGPFRGRPPPKKKLPPPKPLTSLPTPHMLKSDSTLLNSVEFAPPTSYREFQNGRGRDSPVGTPRPFSPAVRAYSPLVSSFDNLSPIPSPHALRKSGTFTSLDFSPHAPRFLGRDGGASDTGSIRSARSGVSAVQMDAMRSGAYRVSRIPKEYVTSRADLSKQLRPKMDLTSYA